MLERIDGFLTRYDPRLRYAMGLFYTLAGVSHFLAPKGFARAVPPWLPRDVGLVHLSGVAEIVFGVGVFFERTRRRSAWGIVSLLIAVFPANVHMARSEMLGAMVPDWAVGIARVLAWVRLPFQALLLYWAWRYTRPGSDGSVSLRTKG